MGGDYTRDGFDPRHDFSAVRMQQGRVQLDSDWNEQAAILDRRLRAGSLDAIGPAAVAADTPDAFRIRLHSGALSVGIGRLYVDGLLAENHGDDSDPARNGFDPALGEEVGVGPTAYTAQPYLAEADTDPLPDTGNAAIAYLDVWQREITSVMEADIVEPAVGVDTTTRMQTAWQVRLQPVSDPYLARADLEHSPAWQSITAPVNGRMSTVPVGGEGGHFPASGPNHLYRVQIHGSGAAGRATFKWSRDNASFVSTVLSLNADRTQVQVSSTRTDSIRAFAVDDWVEVLDDRRELSGKPGQLAKVREVDHVSSRLTVSPAVNADFDPTDAARHTRVIRWDQKGSVSGPEGTTLGDVDTWNGAIPIPTGGGTVVLEGAVAVSFHLAGAHARRPHGAGRVGEIAEVEIIDLLNEVELVEITTSPAPRRAARRPDARSAQSGDPFRTGDYWLITARGGDVDRLTEAPPRGVHHHFAPLAIVAPPSRVVDCRVILHREARGERGGCGCTVCVSPRSHQEGSLTVQAAVDRVRDGGGTVCLESGTYMLDQTLDLASAASVTVRGQGWSTVLTYVGEEPVVSVSGAIGVKLEDVSIVAGAAGTSRAGGLSGLARHASAQLRSMLESIHDALAQYSGAAGAAVLIRDSSDVLLSGCRLVQLGWRASSPPVVAVGGALLDMRATRCVIVGGAGIGNQLPSKESQVLDAELVADALKERASDQWDYAFARLVVDDNLIWCERTGVSLDGFSLHAGGGRIVDNRVGHCRQGGIVMRGRLVTSGANEAGACEISGNTLAVAGDGIVVGIDNACVVGNEIGPFGEVQYGQRAAVNVPLTDNPEDLGEAGDGVVLAPGLVQRLDGCEVRGNRIRGVGRHGVHIRARVDNARISSNLIEGVAGLGIAMTGTSAGGALAVYDNEIVGVMTQPHLGKKSVGAIDLHGLDRVAVSRNRVDGVGVNSGANAGRDAVRLTECKSISVAGNYLDIGTPERDFSPSAGIEIDDKFEDVSVVDNQVRIGRSDPPQELWMALRIGSEWVPLKGQGSGQIQLRARRKAGKDDEGDITDADRLQIGGSVSVRGNLLEADGSSLSTVQIVSSGPVLFNDNRCSSLNMDSVDTGIVRISALSAIVNSNYVLGPINAGIAIEIQIPDPADRCVATDNLTSAPLKLNDGSVHLPDNNTNLL